MTHLPINPSDCKFTLTATLPAGEVQQVVISQSAIVEAIINSGAFKVYKLAPKLVHEECLKGDMFKRWFNGVLKNRKNIVIT